MEKFTPKTEEHRTWKNPTPQTEEHRTWKKSTRKMAELAHNMEDPAIDRKNQLQERNKPSFRTLRFRT